MLSLALFRHAKSSWDDASADDFDRPLNARGRAAAPYMGRRIGELGFAPDLILCSSAKRTRETLELAFPAPTRREIETRFEDGLYLTSAEELLARLRKVPPSKAAVMMIGHNPGMQALALKLADGNDSPDLARMEEKFPTAAVAVFTFPQTSWHDVQPGTGRLSGFLTPRDRS